MFIPTIFSIILFTDEKNKNGKKNKTKKHDLLGGCTKGDNNCFADVLMWGRFSTLAEVCNLSAF